MVLSLSLNLNQNRGAQVVYTLPQGPDPDAALFSESGAMNVMFFLDKVGLGRRDGSLSLHHVRG